MGQRRESSDYSEEGECAFALIEPIHYGVDLGRDDDVHRIYYSFFEELTYLETLRHRIHT